MRSCLVPGAVLLCLALPFSASASEAAVANPPSAAPPSAASIASVERPSAFQLGALQFASGAAAAVVAVPASVALSAWLGGLSSSLLFAALPAVISFVALPPLAVTFAAYWVGNLLSPGSARLWPAAWTTLGAQVLVLAGAMLLGVHGQNLGDVALLTLLETALLPAVTVGTMRLWSPPAQQASPLQARRPLPDPSRPAPVRRLSLPVVSCSF